VEPANSDSVELLAFTKSKTGRLLGEWKTRAPVAVSQVLSDGFCQNYVFAFIRVYNRR